MDDILASGALAGTLADLALLAHVGTALVAGWRLRHIPQGASPTLPTVTVIRPVCGLDAVEMKLSRRHFNCRERPN